VRKKIIQLARFEWHEHGVCEINPEEHVGDMISESDGNGCWVQAWVWVDFGRTELDKAEYTRCLRCDEVTEWRDSVCPDCGYSEGMKERG